MCLFLLQSKCEQYWPHERSVRYQYYVVDPIAEYNMPQYKLREFKVSKRTKEIECDASKRKI